MATLTFEPIDKTITVKSPDTTVTIQELVDAIADWWDDPQNLDIGGTSDGGVFAFWGGKISLGGGEFTGITLILTDDWRVLFEDRAGPTYESMTVTGGNLVAINAFSDNPIKPSAFTQVQIRQSTSPTLVNAGISDFWDALRSAHTVAGSFGEGVRGASILTGVIDSVALDATATAEIADRLLGRTISGGADGGRTVTSALRVIRNRQRIAAGTITFYEEDDSTVSHTGAVTTAAGDPIVEIDPT